MAATSRTVSRGMAVWWRSGVVAWRVVGSGRTNLVKKNGLGGFYQSLLHYKTREGNSLE